ncbi:MAG: ZIP family metal transporter [Hydrogenothermaceae bacterium]
MILESVLGSLFAGLLTAVGGIPIIFGKKISTKWQDSLLGFSAGIMLSASFFSLLLPALELSQESFSKEVSIILVSIFFLGGGFLFLILDRFIPDDYFIKVLTEEEKRSLKKVWLFVSAITLHNFPEGMSSALGFMTGNVNQGITLALGIGIQNIPEGFAVALALYLYGYSRLKSFKIALLTGLIEPIGGIFAVSVFYPFLTFLFIGFAFASGAMLFVVIKEMIPEIQKKGFEVSASIGVLIGFVFMMILDVVLS